jgi:hypothetical protein
VERTRHALDAEALDHEEARLEAFAAAAAGGPGSRSGGSAALTD